MQPAENRLGADNVRVLASVTRAGSSEAGDSWWWIRNIRAQCHVRTPRIVMRDPGFQNGPQMRFRHGNHPIQALAPNRADNSLTNRIHKSSQLHVS